MPGWPEKADVQDWFRLAQRDVREHQRLGAPGDGRPHVRFRGIMAAATVANRALGPDLQGATFPDPQQPCAVLARRKVKPLRGGPPGRPCPDLRAAQPGNPRVGTKRCSKVEQRGAQRTLDATLLM